MPAPVVVAGAAKAGKAVKIIRQLNYVRQLRRKKKQDNEKRTNRRIILALILFLGLFLMPPACTAIILAPVGIVVTAPVAGFTMLTGAMSPDVTSSNEDYNSFWKNFPASSGNLEGFDPGAYAAEANGDNPNSAAILQAARQLLGIPYVPAGNSPERGFDCSGFTQYVYSQVGIRIPRTAGMQYQGGLKVSDPQPGDLIYWGYGVPTDEHVAIYIGGGKMIHAPHPGKTVCIIGVVPMMHGTPPRYFRYM